MKFSRLNNREKSILLRQNYRVWKKEAMNSAGFFCIFQGFLEMQKLKNISGNALKLYIYLGLHSNNREGIVWHSNKRIGEYFSKSERTIRLWMRELIDLNLIKRMRTEYDGIVYTYLQPYIEKKLEKNDLAEGILYFNKKGDLYFQEDFSNDKFDIDECEIEIYSMEDEEYKEGVLSNINGKYYFCDNYGENTLYLDFNIKPFLIIKCRIKRKYIDKNLTLFDEKINENNNILELNKDYLELEGIENKLNNKVPKEYKFIDISIAWFYKNWENNIEKFNIFRFNNYFDKVKLNFNEKMEIYNKITSISTKGGWEYSEFMPDMIGIKNKINNELVGYSIINYKKEKSLKINLLHVKDKLNKLIFKNALLEIIERFAKVKKCKEIYVYIKKEDVEKIEFYVNNGFVFIRERKDIYINGEWQNFLLYGKSLNEIFF